MCDGEGAHRAEMERYLRETGLHRRVTGRSPPEKARVREADALVALWKLLTERLAGGEEEHARWCGLLRGQQ